MPDLPIPEPESSPTSVSSGPESDLGELAALFAAHSGGSFSAEVSADLALDIVLNEIVEQACLSTGATGAAIILERDGEMVCRGSSGADAPQFGARLGSESGLTAECIRTRQAQRCDDAQTDPRADMEASRILGIRSVMILPLLCGGELAGLLEVFSARAGAFGERDELTLEALGQRILKNLERAGEALVASQSAASESTPTVVGAEVMEAPSRLEPPVAANELENVPAVLAPNVNEEVEAAAESAGTGPRAGFDVVTFALTAAVVVCAVLLATLVGLRVSSQRAAVRGKVAAPAVSAAQPETNAEPTSSGAESARAPVSDKKEPVQPDAVGVRAKESSVPAGSLLVYENGKEVFRMTPGGEPSAASATGKDANKVERASAVELNGAVEVSPEAAEGSVLHRVEPEYPEAARQQRMQGAVVLDVRIGRDGVVQSVKVVSGESVLADAAIAAVKQWRFKPEVREGRAVEMQTRITLNFKMPG